MMRLCIGLCLLLTWLRPAVSDCMETHKFCAEEGGGIRTNQPDVVYLIPSGNELHVMNGPIRVRSGDRLQISGILSDAALHIRGGLIVSGGARLEVHGATVATPYGDIELRDDSSLLVALDSILLYGECAYIGRDVELTIEASPFDERLGDAIVVMRGQTSKATEGACLNGSFASVRVGGLAGQSGQVEYQGGQSCQQRAGSLSTVFGAATCPTTTMPPTPRPPARVIIDPPSTNASTPQPTDDPRHAESNQDQQQSGGTGGVDNSVLWAIVGTAVACLVLMGAFMIAARLNPQLRARFFPHADHVYDVPQTVTISGHNDMGENVDEERYWE